MSSLLLLRRCQHPEVRIGGKRSQALGNRVGDDARDRVRCGGVRGVGQNPAGGQHLGWGQGQKQGEQSEATAVIQARDEGGS